MFSGASAVHRRRRLFLAFTAMCIAMCVVTSPYVMDDALITLRYAKHLATYGRATWNPPGSEPPRIGYTSIAWMALEAAICLAVKDADARISCAKLAAGVALILIAWLFADRLSRGGISPAAATVFGLLLFANCGHGLHVNSAMETMLFCAVTLLVIWSRERGQTPLWSYVWAAIGTAVRPEGLFLIPVLAWFDLRGGRRKSALVGSALAAVVCIAVVVLWFAAYDFPIPSAFSIKVGGPYPKRYGTLAVTFFVLFCAPLFLAWCFPAAFRGHSTSSLALVMSIGLMTIFAFVRPMMNNCFRYEWPALFWLAFGAVPLLEKDSIVQRWPGLLISVLSMVLNMRTSIIAVDHAWRRGTVFHDVDRRIGQALARTMRPGEWLAVTDAGRVPYFADVPTHDALGLADGYGGRRGSAWSVLCRPEVAVVVIGASDDNTEDPRILAGCGFHQRADVGVLRCGPHWYATSVFARNVLPWGREGFESAGEGSVSCEQPLWNGDMSLKRLNTWLWWDGSA